MRDLSNVKTIDDLANLVGLSQDRASNATWEKSFKPDYLRLFYANLALNRIHHYANEEVGYDTTAEFLVERFLDNRALAAKFFEFSPELSKTAGLRDENAQYRLDTDVEGSHGMFGTPYGHTSSNAEDYALTFFKFALWNDSEGFTNLIYDPDFKSRKMTDEEYNALVFDVGSKVEALKNCVGFDRLQAFRNEIVDELVTLLLEDEPDDIHGVPLDEAPEENFFNLPEADTEEEAA